MEVFRKDVVELGKIVNATNRGLCELSCYDIIAVNSMINFAKTKRGSKFWQITQVGQNDMATRGIRPNWSIMGSLMHTLKISKDAPKINEERVITGSAVITPRQEYKKPEGRYSCPLTEFSKLIDLIKTPEWKKMQKFCPYNGAFFQRSSFVREAIAILGQAEVDRLYAEAVALGESIPETMPHGGNAPIARLMHNGSSGETINATETLAIDEPVSITGVEQSISLPEITSTSPEDSRSAVEHQSLVGDNCFMLSAREDGELNEMINSESDVLIPETHAAQGERPLSAVSSQSLVCGNSLSIPPLPPIIVPAKCNAYSRESDYAHALDSQIHSNSNEDQLYAFE